VLLAGLRYMPWQFAQMVLGMQRSSMSIRPDARRYRKQRYKLPITRNDENGFVPGCLARHLLAATEIERPQSRHSRAFRDPGVRRRVVRSSSLSQLTHPLPRSSPRFPFSSPARTHVRRQVVRSRISRRMGTNHSRLNERETGRHSMARKIFLVGACAIGYGPNAMQTTDSIVTGNAGNTGRLTEVDPRGGRCPGSRSQPHSDGRGASRRRNSRAFAGSGVCVFRSRVHQPRSTSSVVYFARVPAAEKIFRSARNLDSVSRQIPSSQTMPRQEMLDCSGCRIRRA
jgi:hypothetical protein